MPKRGDVVLYTQGSRTYNAIVLAESIGEDSRLGANDEPALHLSVLFDDPIDTATRKPKVMPVGYIPEMTVVHDVVHSSQKYDAAHFEKYGPDAHKLRGAGEWREAMVGVPARVVKGAKADEPAKVQ